MKLTDEQRRAMEAAWAATEGAILAKLEADTKKRITAKEIAMVSFAAAYASLAREIEALIADRETLVVKLNSIAYRSSLPDAYQEGFDEAIGAAIKIVSGDENLNLWKREDEDTRYAAIHREIEALRQFVTEIGYVEFGDDLIARRNDADGSFVLFEEDNPVYSVTGSDAFDVWQKWKQEGK